VAAFVEPNVLPAWDGERMTEPDPAVLEAVAQLARDLPHVDADEAWVRLAHLTPAQRADVEQVMHDTTAGLPAPAQSTRADGPAS